MAYSNRRPLSVQRLASLGIQATSRPRQVAAVRRLANRGKGPRQTSHRTAPLFYGRPGIGCRSGRSDGVDRPQGSGGGERMRGSCIDVRWSCMSSFRCGTATARGQASLGGSSTRVGRPGRKGPGTPEGVPRTTAIKRPREHKKSACDEDLALTRLSIPTGQGRVTDASATEEIYSPGRVGATAAGNLGNFPQPAHPM